MSGEPPSRTPRQRVDEFAGDVERYASLEGLVPPDPQAVRVESYLAWTPDDLDKLREYELSRAMVDAKTYAYKVQRSVNRAKVRLRGLRAEANKRNSDAEARSFRSMINCCEAYIERWDWTVQRIESLSNTVEKFTFTKKGS